MTTSMYHGTFDEIVILKARSYVTPDLETAREYGPKVYAVDVIFDHDLREEINGRLYIVGFEEGTCSRIRQHIDMPHVREAQTRIDMPVRQVD